MTAIGKLSRSHFWERLLFSNFTYEYWYKTFKLVKNIALNWNTGFISLKWCSSFEGKGEYTLGNLFNRIHDISSPQVENDQDKNNEFLKKMGKSEQEINVSLCIYLSISLLCVVLTELPNVVHYHHHFIMFENCYIIQQTIMIKTKSFWKNIDRFWF